MAFSLPSSHESASGSVNPLREFRLRIITALESKKHGQSEGYDRLVQETVGCFRDLSKLRVFVECVSGMDDKYHERLLRQLLGTSLWTCSLEVADILIDLALHLVAANGTCLHLSINMIVSNFLPPSCGIPAFMGAALGSGSALRDSLLQARQNKEEELGRQKEVGDKVHFLADRLLHLAPAAGRGLLAAVVNRMPHKRLEKEFQCLYLSGVLRLASCPAGRALKDELLVAVVAKLIQMDVDIRWEDILEQEEGSKTDMFEMDLEYEPEMHAEDGIAAASPDDTEVAGHHGLMGARGGPVASLDEMADKMDFCMDLVLGHIEERVGRGEVEEVYRALLHSFHTTVLETHRAKFTQFLMFYLCSLSPSTCGAHFSSLLCDILLDKSKYVVTRLSASAYLASFAARAKYLPLPLVITAVERLAAWCVQYGAEDEGQQQPRAGGWVMRMGERHALFYSSVQALLYILCYRMKALAGCRETGGRLRGLPLAQILRSRLNPRRVVLESVVEEFSRQVAALGLVPQDVIGQDPTATGLPPVEGFGDPTVEVRVDMFFPFDPYLLRLSNRFVKPIFRKWQHVEYEEVEAEGEESGGGGRESDTKSRGSEEGNGGIRSDSDTEGSPESDSGSASKEDEDEDEDVGNRIAFSFQSDQSIAWASSMEEHRGVGGEDEGGVSDEDWNLGAMSISPPVGRMRMPPVLPVKSRSIPTMSRRKFE